jgi:hypothetical protein
LFLILFLLALFLFPIGVYCSILGMINRRPQPLMVSGAWDFLGVLFATSGFILFGGPALLSGTFRQSLQDVPFSRDSGSVGGAVTEIWAMWWLVWVLYYLFVVGGAAFLLWQRRDISVIYNIDPQTLDRALAAVAERLNLEIDRRGERVYFGVAHGTEPAETHITAEPGTVTAPPPRLLDAPVVVDLESFAMLSNVSLHWHPGNSAARADVERELRRALAETFAPDNPAAGWLLGVSALVFLLIMVLTAVFVLMVLLNPRH